MERLNPLDAAQRIVKVGYPETAAALITGSALTDERTPTSGLDIVIVLRGGPAPFRETIREFGWPVELFVHTPASINFFSNLEASGHRATTQKMIADGRILVSKDEEAERLQTAAHEYLALGPPPPSNEEMTRRRHNLTSQLDDLIDATDSAELLFIVGQVVVGVSELALLTKLHWLATGKWLPRHLAVSNPDLSKRLVDATTSAITGGDKKLMEVIVLEILERVGGPLREGYRVADVAMEPVMDL